MSEDERSGDADSDPTADFLASVRPEETPWRTERPAAAAGDPGPAEPERWRRTRAAARAAGQAAPYVQAATLVGWLATEGTEVTEGTESTGDTDAPLAPDPGVGGAT
ncbi:hypothetical protein [Qaidamihabitans albus]|uniref:hypothetical protein n=1 Tax=Qaidamihabitans albus TaxID=2795733 RepID=UPI001F2827C7|nr:hypothetical protein [Qaidamihabitans albus]